MSRGQQAPGTSCAAPKVNAIKAMPTQVRSQSMTTDVQIRVGRIDAADFYDRAKKVARPPARLLWTTNSC